MSKKTRAVPVLLALLSSGVGLTAVNASAATNQFRGVNWADPRDNFQAGNVYVSGLSATDTYSSAATTADKVVSGFVGQLGTNSVRMPINEATVSKYWSTYTGAIDVALSKGVVILCFWSAAHGGKPADMTAYWAMWKTVVDKYGKNPNAFFELYNEPSSYSKADLGALYASWLTQFASVPRARVILDGTSLAQNIPDIGADSRFDGCLLAVHEYSMFGQTSWTTEAQWVSHFKSYVGTYADRTVCTEWGGPMGPGSKNGIDYAAQDYNSPPGSYFVAYIRAVSGQLRAWNMGGFYWAGLKDGDWYSLTTKTGSGGNIALSVVNQSGLDRLKYSFTSSAGGSGGGGGAPSGGSSGQAGNGGTSGSIGGAPGLGGATSSSGGAAGAASNSGGAAGAVSDSGGSGGATSNSGGAAGAVSSSGGANVGASASGGSSANAGSSVSGSGTDLAGSSSAGASAPGDDSSGCAFVAERSAHGRASATSFLLGLLTAYAGRRAASSRRRRKRA